jgi:hypothetical protein
MTAVRKRLSTATAWAMIPLAAWAGMPSTACICSNGRVKLFCQHLLGWKQANPPACASDCCAHKAAEDPSDCCSACSYGVESDVPGVGSKSCCNPVVTSPSVPPETVSIPCHCLPAVVAAVERIGATVRPSVISEPTDLDTGPPLDRVIVFRALLI